MSQPPDQCDAMILGGGPAGLAAAIVLGRAGRSVVLCERRALPANKTCGEGVMPTGLAMLDQLGARARLDSQQMHPMLGVTFRTPHGTVAAADFAEGPGAGIRRTNLSQALLAEAQHYDSVTVLDEQPVRQFQVLDHGVEVALAERTITARLLIGADGIGSRVRRDAGLEASPRRLRRLGARQHFSVTPWTNHVEVTGSDGIEAYVTPCGPQQIGVSLLWDSQRYTAATGGDALMPSLLAPFPHLRERLNRAEALSAPLSAGPLYRVAKDRTADGVILLGDAGGYLDACTGEGITLALAQALSLRESIVPALQGQDRLLRKPALAKFELACKAGVAAYLTGTRVVLWLHRHPRVRERVIRSFAREPKLLQHLLSANLGQASFWPGWSAAWQLAVGLLR